MEVCWNTTYREAIADGSDRCGRCKKPQLIGGRYQVVGSLGGGAFGEVYLTSHVELKRKTAVKQLKPGASGTFLDEAQAMAALKHPHIITIYEYSAGPPAFIAMDYSEGGTLRDAFDDPKRIVAIRASALLQLCDALGHAHKQGLIHRDLKPENVLLDVANNAYLSDFGLAKVFDKATSIAGSPAYMAPEVMHGDYDTRADLYSLGVLAYELYVGHRPYDGSTFMELYNAKVSETATAPHIVNAAVKPAISNAIMRLLAADPEKRTQTAVAAARDLRLAAQTHRHVESIDEFRRMLSAIYGEINREREESGVVNQIVVHAASLLKLSMTGANSSLVATASAQCAAWLLAYATLKRWEMSRVISGKYQAACPYCAGVSCGCNLAGTHRHVGWSEPGTTLAGIDEYQEMFARVYDDKNRKLAPMELAAHLVNEVAELVEVCTKLPEGIDKASRQRAELADCFAWLFAIAQKNGHRLEQALNDEYPGMCKRCEQPTCVCSIASMVLSHKQPGLL